MTFRQGDIPGLPFKLASIFGAGSAPVYANLAAFLAAGWTFSFLQNGAVMSTTPTITSLLPDANNDGTHYLNVTLPQGVTTIRPIPPPTRKDLYAVADLLIIVGLADVDSLSAAINSATGAVVAGGITTNVTDQSMTEGDSFAAQFTIPSSSLKIFDNANKLIYTFSNLADISGNPWTIAAQARYLTEGGQLPTIPVAFSFQAQVLDKTNNVVGIGLAAATAGAVIDDVLPTAPTITVGGGLITSVSGGLGGHIYGTNTVTITLSGGGGSGGVITANIVNGQIASYTITNPGSGYGSAPTAALSVASDGSVASRTFRVDVQLQPPAASTYAGSKLTVVSFNLIINRQQTTTP